MCLGLTVLFKIYNLKNKLLNHLEIVKKPIYLNLPYKVT